MCVECRIDVNADKKDYYFAYFECVLTYLQPLHPILWLRDSSYERSGYIARDILNSAGTVLAIWNSLQKKGWHLRTYPQQALDEVPDPSLSRFVKCIDDGEIACLIMRLD